MSRINPLMISKTLLIFVIVNFVSESHGQTAERFFRKDYTYMGQFGSFYKIHTIPHTWADAKRVCALEGATLWHPEGRDESYNLLEFYKNRETSLNIVWIFTGLSDLLVEGVFETVDGMSFYQVYNNWESGQPDNHLGKQNCVRINLHTKLMDDEHCYLKYPFVCKKSISSLKWDQQCNMANLDYTYNKDSGKCYKLHKTPLKWTDAYAVCQAEQSSLAVIRNRSDADYLLNLTKSGADFVKPGRYVSYQRGIYHLGFHNRLTEGWQTVTDGQKEKKFFRKDYTYLDDFESFYKIHVIPQPWIEAKRMCEREGAILWHPDTNEEARGVMKFWNKTKPRTKWLYVGLSDLLVEGVFVTVDGNPVSEVYNNWEPDTPDNGVTEGGDQDCVYIYLNKGPGYLDDEACHEKYSYMCRKRLQSVEWNYQCDMPYLDYTFNKENGYCYKLHTTPLNWTDAYVVCQGEQSSLAVIRSPSDAEYLARLTDITPKPRIKGSYQKGIFHLGFHSRFSEDWLSISGTQLNLDSDAWYDHYQPDGNDPDDCGSMLHSGRLINVNCETKSLFICEHAVDIKTSPETVSATDTMLLQPYIGARVD